jgi:hypothetical protein
MTPRQQVTRFCREQGLHVNTKGNIPVLSRGNWFTCFDTWQDAQKFLFDQYRAKQDEAKPYVWMQS